MKNKVAFLKLQNWIKQLKVENSIINYKMNENWLT